MRPRTRMPSVGAGFDPPFGIVHAVVALAIGAAVSMAPLAAAAQAKGKASAAPAVSGGKKGRVVTFGEEGVEATYMRPEGTAIHGINKKKRQSLIRVRTDFYNEIRRSARDI